ncbi:MAG: hypothetical protein M1818_003009 [Claussenomyces sp. TS43310]|nr:MAG: hypothetical protein M1818_003009 [Claussenomyces sp. TS43310]
MTVAEHEMRLLKRDVLAFQSPQDALQIGDTQVSSCCTSGAGNTVDANTEVQNHTVLSQTIQVLEGTLNTKPQTGTSTASKKASDNNISHGIMGPSSKDAEGSRPTSNNVASLRHAFDVYFSYINPNLPFLSENDFRASFDNYLVTGGNEMHGRSKDVFIVLVNFIYAEAMLLSERCPPSSQIPGWPEFCFAERIVSRLPWLSGGNIQIIQCLLIKAHFLITIQRIRSAYDTMCKAVQICFHIGLNNQASWSGLTLYETVMRQRIFWSMFYLERGIALHAGLPYLLRESDFNVDFPMSIDDKYLFATRPIPDISPSFSYIPYLNGLVGWSKLCSRIWDAMFSVNAPKPASEELIASLDAEILYSLSQLHRGLWWDPDVLKSKQASDVPPYVRRQMCLSHLVGSEMLAHTMLEECLWIATSSINAIEDYRTFCLPNSMYRHSSVMYLTAAVIPLICVIVHESNHQCVREEVVQTFSKAMDMLQDIAPSFALARLMLHRLEAAAHVATQAIERSRVGLDHISEVDMSGGVDSSQRLVDLFRELEKPSNEPNSNNEAFLAADGATDALSDGFPLDMDDMNVFAADLNNQFDWSWSTSVPIV